MSLAKQHFAKLRVFLYDTHAQPCGAVRWSILPGAYSCAAKVLLSAVVACWWWWLASCLPSPPGLAPGLVLLLLDLLLITCPSPPGLGLELQSIIMVLLEVFLCLSDTVQELVLFLVLCARTVVFLWWFSAGRVSVASSGHAHLLQLLARLIAVVLPAASLSQMTELLVSS
jgi:hypothetical protein